MRRLIYFSIILIAAMVCPQAINAQVNTEQVMRVGQNALYFEDYVLSIQYFNQVIQAKPYLAQPYLMRAIAKINLDDYAGAELDATKAIELNPFLTDAWEVRGVARQNQGRNESAVNDYDEALKLLPHNRQMMFNKALALTEIKEYEKADTTFTELLKFYPNFDNGYLGRAKLRLAQQDTISASDDIEKALSLNKNALNGYILRAAIAIDHHENYEQALQDMNQALKLEPRLTGLYINRAYLRYQSNDYFGAMADYDYALELEPYNVTALFNRSLLLMEVGDNDRAYKDLSLILKMDPEDYRARYNRALVNGLKRNYDEAIADVDMVIERFPDFSGAYYMRSEFLRERGDLRKAKNDYDTAWDLAKKATNVEGKNQDDVPEELTPEAASKRFNNLLTIENDTHIDEEYNNSAIRGRVQDRDLTIEIEPLIEISFYSSPSELKQDTYYFKEVEDINATRMLRYIMVVTPKPPTLNDPDLIQKHFNSIDYYNSYISTHSPRTIDYLGRAMDLITVRNYAAAIEDLNRATALNPDHAVSYFMRAQARYHGMQTAPDQSQQNNSAPGIDSKRVTLQQVLADYDRAIELSPRTAVAWFDKGNILFELGDYTSAISAYNKAIEFQPNMGEAYYNRGYVHFKLGNQRSGIDDLSKAGELGIVSAYNLLKKISKTL